MTEYFKILNETEYQKLLDAIPLITTFIAGADGSIDEEETQWAEKVAKIRSYKMSEDLLGFYQEVGTNFSAKLNADIAALPKDQEARQNEIATKLAELNPIMAKLHPKLGSHLYKSYISFAKHVAKASGGFFGFFSIGPQEKALLGLTMIDPIEFDEEAEAAAGDEE